MYPKSTEDNIISAPSTIGVCDGGDDCGGTGWECVHRTQLCTTLK